MGLSIHHKTNIICILIVILCFSTNSLGYQIGVYYFPGWNKDSKYWNDLLGTPDSKSPGKAWMDRESQLGFKYDGGSKEIAEKQIEWAYRYGIDFFIYDWYWTKDNTPRLEESLHAYLKADNRNLLKFCLLWCNHVEPPTKENFKKAVEYWLENFFNQKQYFAYENKPVVFVFAPDNLEKGAKSSDTTVKEYLEEARKMAIKKGFNGIYFVACAYDLVRDIKSISDAGYDAMSGYFYYRSWLGYYEKGGEAKNYNDLINVYSSTWKWILEKSSLPYFIPMAAGYDARPWGKNKILASSTPESFYTMLQEGKDIMDRYPDRTQKIGIIYAWNEFGEGGYIEPTKKWGFQYLEKIKQVFGGR